MYRADVDMNVERIVGEMSFDERPNVVPLQPAEPAAGAGATQRTEDPIGDSGP